MKKLLSFILIAAMILSLSACGQSTSESGQNSQPAKVEAKQFGFAAGMPLVLFTDGTIEISSAATGGKMFEKQYNLSQYKNVVKMVCTWTDLVVLLKEDGAIEFFSCREDGSGDIGELADKKDVIDIAEVLNKGWIAYITADGKVGLSTDAERADDSFYKLKEELSTIENAKRLDNEDFWDDSLVVLSDKGTVLYNNGTHTHTSSNIKQIGRRGDCLTLDGYSEFFKGLKISKQYFVNHSTIGIDENGTVHQRLDSGGIYSDVYYVDGLTDIVDIYYSERYYGGPILCCLKRDGDIVVPEIKHAEYGSLERVLHVFDDGLPFDQWEILNNQLIAYVSYYDEDHKLQTERMVIDPTSSEEEIIDFLSKDEVEHGSFTFDVDALPDLTLDRNIDKFPGLDNVDYDSVYFGFYYWLTEDITVDICARYDANDYTLLQVGSDYELYDALNNTFIYRSNMYYECCGKNEDDELMFRYTTYDIREFDDGFGTYDYSAALNNQTYCNEIQGTYDGFSYKIDDRRAYEVEYGN